VRRQVALVGPEGVFIDLRQRVVAGHSQADRNRLQLLHEYPAAVPDSLPRDFHPTATGYNYSMNILVLHGWQSVPGGVKPTFLAQHGHEVFNPKLPDEDFEAALRIAQAEYDRHRPAVVVGSSRGGAVAMNLDSGDTPLVLLCPAWRKHGTARTAKKNTTILHSRADDVVPFSDSEELVRSSGLPASALVEVGSDHQLADPEPLEAMREACKSE
jgi:hypothetical protein